VVEHSPPFLESRSREVLSSSLTAHSIILAMSDSKNDEPSFCLTKGIDRLPASGQNQITLLIPEDVDASSLCTSLLQVLGDQLAPSTWVRLVAILRCLCAGVLSHSEYQQMLRALMSPDMLRTYDRALSAYLSKLPFYTRCMLPRLFVSHPEKDLGNLSFLHSSFPSISSSSVPTSYVAKPFTSSSRGVLPSSASFSYSSRWRQESSPSSSTLTSLPAGSSSYAGISFPLSKDGTRDGIRDMLSNAYSILHGSSEGDKVV